MSFWERWLKKDKPEEALVPVDNSVKGEVVDSKIDYQYIPGTIDLGWYYSENKDQFQMAKIDEKDRATHFYVIGASGTGKTKFLEFLIQQDIEKGNGFGVIDPHGDLIEDIKGFLACGFNEQDLSEKVILIDPTDPQFTVTFNPLEKIPGISIPEQAQELVSAFRKIWSDSWGVRMEDLMRNSLIALGEAGLTLAELPPFLTKRAFRESILEKVSHPIARDYFQRFEALTDRGQITWIEPVMNKINAFLANERIGQIFSSPQSSFNLREIMDQKKILLVKLDKGKLKDTADLLGSLLMAKLQMAAFSRSDIPPDRRVLFYLYIDEFQNFASESFAVVLSEARKYGLSLIMAHQTLAQISEELRSLVLGNTGIQVYFRVNRHDANLLAKEGFLYSGFEVKTMSRFRPVFWSYAEEWEHRIAELQHLPPRVCYVKHKIEGGIIPIRTQEIEPPWEVLGMREHEYRDHIKELPIGRKYLIARQELMALTQQRQALLKEKAAAKQIEDKKAIEQPKLVVKEIERPVLPTKELSTFITKETEEELKVELPAVKVKSESQHKYLQTLIKRMAEEQGFRAIIEHPTPDGQGRVDVSLEMEGKRTACEISITTDETQELGNIEKCLAAGYDQVILCSPDKKTLEKAKNLILQRVKEGEKEKVLFFQPEELFFFLEQEAAQRISKEERVKGYKVKVQYQAVEGTEKKTKQKAVAQVILQALRRLKDK